MKIDYLEGKNPVQEALKAGRGINKILIAKGVQERSIKDLLALAKERQVPIQWVTKDIIEEKALTKAHQGILALATPIKYFEVEDLLALAEERNEPPFIIILDHLEDPHNLGAILRTAEAVGAHGVVIPKNRSVAVTSTVAKTSAGALEYVPIARVTNLNQAIKVLKAAGCWVVGTDGEAREHFHKANLTGAIALVIGSEGKGMSRLVKENCDFTVRIPMRGKINSLNASVAASVILYEIFKQRMSN